MTGLAPSPCKAPKARASPTGAPKDFLEPVVPTDFKLENGSENNGEAAKAMGAQDIQDIMEAKASGAEERAVAGLIAAGGLLGAVAASSCCILPLVLFSLGISGAWIGNLTALAPYQPVLAAATLGLLGYGFYLVYRRPKICAKGEVCARPLTNRLVKVALWSATALVAAALVFPYAAPALLRI